MKRGPALLVHSLKRYRTLLLVMGGVLAGFQILLCLAAVTLQESNSFGPLLALIPEPMRQAFGPALIVLMSFTGIVGIGYIHIAVIAALVGMVISIGTEPAAEIETRFIDLVMAHPLPRYWIVCRTIIMLAGSTIFVLFLMALGSAVGIYWLAPKEALQPSLVAVRSLALNLAVLMLSWGGIALALASFAKRRGVPAGIAGVLALSSYLADYLARIWKPATHVAWLCPFHYYNAVDMIGGASLPLRDLCILGAIAVSGFGIAWLAFSRRDL